MRSVYKLFVFLFKSNYIFFTNLPVHLSTRLHNLKSCKPFSDQLRSFLFQMLGSRRSGPILFSEEAKNIYDIQKNSLRKCVVCHPSKAS